jgi:hypothetical protein
MLKSTCVRGALAAVLAMSAAGAVAAQGMPKTLKIDTGGQSATTGGVLRCDPGQETQFALIGEDAEMTRVPLELYASEAHSTDEKVVRAVVPDYSASIINVRCEGDGEAWIVATATGVRTQFPVLVGKAKRQPNVKAPAPTE